MTWCQQPGVFNQQLTQYQLWGKSSTNHAIHSEVYTVTLLTLLYKLDAVVPDQERSAIPPCQQATMTSHPPQSISVSHPMSKAFTSMEKKLGYFDIPDSYATDDCTIPYTLSLSLSLSLSLCRANLTVDGWNQPVFGWYPWRLSIWLIRAPILRIVFWCAGHGKWKALASFVCNDSSNDPRNDRHLWISTACCFTIEVKHMFLADIIIQRLSRVKPLGPAPLKGWKASNGSKDMHRPFGAYVFQIYIYIIYK